MSLTANPVDRRVAALAGRRPDASGSKDERFPPAAFAKAREPLRDLLLSESVTCLVCSAAAGADLTALECAESMGLAYRIVLPFSKDRFREISVVDRDTRWGEPFDRLSTLAQAAGDLIVLNGDPDTEGVYEAANGRIIEEAESSARGAPLAIALWDGQPRGAGDATADFLARAAAHGFSVRQIPAGGGS